MAPFHFRFSKDIHNYKINKKVTFVKTLKNLKKDIMKLKWSSRYRVVVFIYQILLLYVFLFIARLIYLFANWSYFTPIDISDWWNMFRGGLLFDSASMMYTMLPFVLLSFLGAFVPYKIDDNKFYKGLTKFFYLIPSILNISLNIGDAGYYPYILKRMTRDVFVEFSGDNLWDIVGHLALTFWGYTLVIILSAILLYFLYGLLSFRDDGPKEVFLKRVINVVGNAVTLTCIVFGLVFAVKGDTNLFNVPMTPMKATLFCKNPVLRPVILNTTYCMIRTSKIEILKEVKYFPEDKAKQLFSSIYSANKLSETDSLYASMKGRNIVLLILESMAAEYTGFYNEDIKDYPSYTPFLDSLASESYTVKYAYANGRVSVQAMPSLLLSLPSMGFRFVNSIYTNNKSMGVPQILRKDGYSSVFYHGGVNGTMGFNGFAKYIEFDSYFGKTEYNKDSDFDGLWGIFDEPFLQRVADEISSQSSPSFSTIFTLSSHTPYTLPDKYKTIFTRGTLPIHKVISYSDMALRNFFDKMKMEKDYDNTLFIISADHCSETDRKEYASLTGHYRIPLIFFDPQGKLKGLNTSIVAQQADIMPTLLYLLGNSTPIISYGHNIFDNSVSHYALEKDADVYYMISKNYTLKYDDNNNDVEILPPTPYTQINPKDLSEWTMKEEYKRSIDTLKAIIQDYNYRIIHDKMVLQNENGYR